MRHALVSQLAKELRSSRRQEQFSPAGKTSRPPRAPKFFLPLLPSPPRRGRQGLLRATPLRPGNTKATYEDRPNPNTYEAPTSTCPLGRIPRTAATESCATRAFTCLPTEVRRHTASSRPLGESRPTPRRPRSSRARRLTTPPSYLSPARNTHHPVTTLLATTTASEPYHRRGPHAPNAFPRPLPPHLCQVSCELAGAALAGAVHRPGLPLRFLPRDCLPPRPAAALLCFLGSPGGFLRRPQDGREPRRSPQQSVRPSWEGPVPLYGREAHQRPETRL